MRLGWALGRVREMTPAEVPFRAAEQVRRRRDRGWTPPELPESVLREPLPRWPVRPEALNALAADWKASLRADTDALLRSGFRLLGAWRPASARTDFRLDPDSGRRWPDAPAFDVDLRGAVDVKPAWELGRLQHLQVLALAAALGDEDARDAVISDLRSWLAADRPGRGIAWAAGVEVACRTVSLLVIAALIEVPEALRPAIWRTLDAHGRWLERYPSLYSSANNHRVAELGALAALGALAPQLPRAAAWRDIGRHGLADLLPAQIAPDGVGTEQSPSYQAWTMEWCLVARRALGDAWAAPDADRLLLAGADFLGSLVDRDGNAPAIGDDDGTVVLRQRLAPDRVVLSIAGATAAGLGRPDLVPAPWRPDLRAVLLGLPTALPPACGAIARARSRTFEGYTVLAARRAGHERLVVVDHGPLGFPTLAAHGHADALSVWVHVDGRPLVVDGGTWRYTGAPDWRAWLRGTAAHPTVEIDGRDQSLQRGSFAWHTRANARREAVRLERQGGEVVASHDGYRRLGVVHRRIVRLEGEELVVDDELAPCGGGRPARMHEVRIVWPFAPDLAVAGEGRTFDVSRHGRVVATLTVPAALTARVARQDTIPAPGVHAPSYGLRVAAPTLVLEGAVKLPVTLRTVFRF
jgi:hypothetical protein